MQPLRVTATLHAGIAHASPWTVSLDGLLASQLWQAHKRLHPIAGMRELDNPPDLELPLARCTLDSQWWHWAATCGWPDTPQEAPEIHYWGTRLDHRHTEHTATALPQHLPDNKGRWKAYWMPVPITLTHTLAWHAVGDPDAIRDILAPITSIGKKRSQGEGRIRSWSITPAPDLDPHTASHLSPTGTLGRPCPEACLTQHPDVIDGGPGYATIRPPHMHPSRRTEVRLPATTETNYDHPNPDPR